MFEPVRPHQQFCRRTVGSPVGSVGLEFNSWQTRHRGARSGEARLGPILRGRRGAAGTSAVRPGQAVDLRTRGEDLSVLRAGGDGTDHCGRSGDGQHMWSVPNGNCQAGRSPRRRAAAVGSLRLAGSAEERCASAPLPFSGLTAQRQLVRYFWEQPSGRAPDFPSLRRAARDISQRPTVRACPAAPAARVLHTQRMPAPRDR